MPIFVDIVLNPGLNVRIRRRCCRKGASVQLAESSLYDGQEKGDKEKGEKRNEVFGSEHGVHFEGRESTWIRAH